MTISEPTYRKCLYCYTEIASGRPDNTNFCNGKCLSLFRVGMSDEKYYEETRKNRLFPIRGHISAKDKKAELRRSNTRHVLCALSEYDMCRTVFATHLPNKKSCCYEHQVKYNDIKKQERKEARRNDN